MSLAKQEQNQLYVNGWVEFASLEEVICRNWSIAESDRESHSAIPAWSLGSFFLDMLKPGEVTFVTGLYGSGMTSVALNTAFAFAIQSPDAVVIHSVNQHPKYLAARLLNTAFGISLSVLAGAESTGFCLPASSERLLQLDISIDGRLYESPEAIKASYETMKTPGLIVVNNMNHFPFGIAKHETAAFLKTMAQSLEIPLLVASIASIGIINRASNQDIWPTMLDIRNQGISWQDLDTVVSLYRECEWTGQRAYEFNEAEDADCKIRLLKNHHGPTGTMPVRLSQERLRFEKDGEFAPQCFDPCA